MTLNSKMNPLCEVFNIDDSNSTSITKIESDDKIEVKFAECEKNNEKVVIKLEKMNSTSPHLYLEYRILKILSNFRYFPKLYYFGPFDEQNEQNALIIQRLGPNLDQRFNEYHERFSLKTVLQIAIQAIERIEMIHSRGLIHRRINPQCFLTGLPGTDDERHIYLTDFGLAKEYRDRHSHNHMPFRELRILIGIPRFMCVNAHQYKEQSRKDDLESLGYVLIYFLKGSLPWQTLKIVNLRKYYNAIGEMKANISPQELCADLPSQFVDYMNIVRNMDFIETPNYKRLKQLFLDLFESRRFASDMLFDWNVIHASTTSSPISTHSE